VTMRGKLDANGRPTSWAKIGYALKLVPEGAPKSQAGDAARRAYRQVKGADAPTGLSDYWERHAQASGYLAGRSALEAA
jgi:hypothetical protein